MTSNPQNISFVTKTFLARNRYFADTYRFYLTPTEAGYQFSALMSGLVDENKEEKRDLEQRIQKFSGLDLSEKEKLRREKEELVFRKAGIDALEEICDGKKNLAHKARLDFFVSINQNKGLLRDILLAIENPNLREAFENLSFYQLTELSKMLYLVSTGETTFYGTKEGIPAEISSMLEIDPLSKQASFMASVYFHQLALFRNIKEKTVKLTINKVNEENSTMSQESIIGKVVKCEIYPPAKLNQLWELTIAMGEPPNKYKLFYDPLQRVDGRKINNYIIWLAQYQGLT